MCPVWIDLKIFRVQVLTIASHCHFSSLIRRTFFVCFFLKWADKYDNAQRSEGWIFQSTESNQDCAHPGGSHIDRISTADAQSRCWEVTSATDAHMGQYMRKSVCVFVESSAFCHTDSFINEHGSLGKLDRALGQLVFWKNCGGREFAGTAVLAEVVKTVRAPDGVCGGKTYTHICPCMRTGLYG